MSAVAWTDVLAPAGGPTRPSTGRRGHLVLVPEHVAGESREPVSLRITRRGRLLLTGVVAALLLALVVTALTPGSPAPAVPVATIVVQPGQTLSEIAATHLSTGSLADGIARIQIANNLSSAQVSAGQRLVIPQI